MSDALGAPPQTDVHPTAIVHPSARIGAGAVVGPYAVIGPDTVVGDRAWIGSHAVVEYAEIGPDCKIHPHAFVGTPPQDLKYQGEKTKAVIGARTVVRECVTINRGTAASGVTRVGSNCLIMAYCHVAHDCVLGDNVIMANLATLAGHVHVGDDVVMGGLAAVHQYTRIGFGAMLGGASMVAQDVPPFCLTHGNRAWLVGLNVVGLRRRKLPPANVSALKAAYRTVFLSGLAFPDAVTAVEKDALPAEARAFVDFLKSSKRGFCRPSPRDRGETVDEV
jgi:UDP-N-acetylglucosamine acyltransferase